MSHVKPVMAASVPSIFCSVNQAAKALDMTPYATREMCRTGVIKAIKSDGRWLVSVDDLNRYAHDLQGTA